jgi:hypothetical protein
MRIQELKGIQRAKSSSELGRLYRDGFLAFGGIADILEIRYKDRD